MTNTLATTQPFIGQLQWQVKGFEPEEWILLFQLIRQLEIMLSFVVLNRQELLETTTAILTIFNALQPVLIFLFALVETMVFVWKIGAIVVNVVRFL